MDEVEVESMDMEADMAKLSLNAIQHPEQNATTSMRIKGSYKKRILSILIDTGSWLNFVDKRTIKGLNCSSTPEGDLG